MAFSVIAHINWAPFIYTKAYVPKICFCHHSGQVRLLVICISIHTSFWDLSHLPRLFHKILVPSSTPILSWAHCHPSMALGYTSLYLFISLLPMKACPFHCPKQSPLTKLGDRYLGYFSVLKMVTQWELIISPGSSQVLVLEWLFGSISQMFGIFI